MTSLLNRRIFLRGLGGACVAAPFLSSLAERAAKAQSLPPPKRLIVMFTHYGCITTRFFPKSSHGVLTAEDLEPTTLYPAAFIFKGLGVNIDNTSLNRRLDSANMDGPCVSGAIEQLLKIDDYYARKFAHLVGMLNSITEADGTLLDHSAAVWFHENSDGSATNLNNLPIVQAGSAGGYFKTGWAVNVEDGSSDLTPGNSEGACVPGTPDEISGISQATGTDPSLANAPINKYYCSLMNALGVKAGASGFPTLGGDAEVTHFGRYDKTEDFIGGGTKPAMIHDPGEFTALKAN